MELLEDTLDRISRSGEAAFAIDGGGRITHWNKACERLLGKPARHVLGKHTLPFLMPMHTGAQHGEDRNFGDGHERPNMPAH